MATNLAIDDHLIEEARLVGLHRTKKAVVTESLIVSISKGVNRLKLSHKSKCCGIF